MNTLDLLNEISTSKMAKRTDAQLLGQEQASLKLRTRWTLNNFLPVWEEVEKNYLSYNDLQSKYRMNQTAYKKLCKTHNLKYTHRTTGDTVSEKHKNLPDVMDIINGMKPEEWCKKYGKSRKAYDMRRYRLRKKGLVD